MVNYVDVRQLCYLENTKALGQKDFWELKDPANVERGKYAPEIILQRNIWREDIEEFNPTTSNLNLTYVQCVL